MDLPIQKRLLYKLIGLFLWLPDYLLISSPQASPLSSPWSYITTTDSFPIITHLHLGPDATTTIAFLAPTPISTLLLPSDRAETRPDSEGGQSEQGQRQLLAGRVNMLFRDRRTHAHTRHLMETEAGMSREAWGRAMDASNLAHGEVMSLRTTVHAQMSEITELQSADRRRQRAISDLLETDRRRREEMRELRAADRTRQQQIIQTLTVMQTLQREMIPLQGLVTTLQGQVTALQGQVMTLQGQVTALQGQQGPAGGLAQLGLPEEAGSSS
ncbi:hypothetical protein Tco_1112786 [Tanacetum coccineum]|uniref:Uncharacterized protein n=1 Tax=Tanacetum coccineum TaxID=301880 RepID=A0ABQ5ITC2_9ASTR